MLKILGQNSTENEYNNIFLPRPATILETRVYESGEKQFRLKMLDGTQLFFEPGQILEVSIWGYGEIPISIASSPLDLDTFEIVVRGIGRVSNAVNRKEKGDTLFIRGPLGRGFPMDKMRGENVLLVAGGIGICPLRSPMLYISERRHEFKNVTIFYGCQTPEKRFFLEELSKLRKSDYFDFHEIVDRAGSDWEGPIGTITSLFEKTKIPADSKVIICGPPIMFSFVIEKLDQIGIDHSNIYLDVERRMKCGVGKCGHCQMNDKYVCTDGPVFSYTEIKNLEDLDNG